MPTWDETSYRRAHRIRVNRKWKRRDRLKAKLGGWMYWKYPKHSDPKWFFGRRRAATETGYGVAYERNPESRKY